jgi:hypothetical protein
MKKIDMNDESVNDYYLSKEETNGPAKGNNVNIP